MNGFIYPAHDGRVDSRVAQRAAELEVCRGGGTVLPPTSFTGSPRDRCPHIAYGVREVPYVCVEPVLVYRR